MFLPEGLLAHFDVVSSHILGDVQTKKDCFYIYLDEKNILPEPYSSKDYETNRTEIKSDYSFIADGSKLTVELSDFLKGTGRDPRRYDK